MSSGLSPRSGLRFGGRRRADGPADRRGSPPMQPRALSFRLTRHGEHSLRRGCHYAGRLHVGAQQRRACTPGGIGNLLIQYRCATFAIAWSRTARIVWSRSYLAFELAESRRRATVMTWNRLVPTTSPHWRSNLITPAPAPGRRGPIDRRTFEPPGQRRQQHHPAKPAAL